MSRIRVEAGEGWLLRFLQFLGHELRTPLTAARTALEVLAGESSGPRQRDREMAALALRNIDRLGRTLDWVEPFLASRCLPLPGERRRWWVADLVAQIAPEGAGSGGPRWTVSEAAAAGEVECDAELLSALVQQVLHAVRYHAPGRDIVATVEPAAAASDAVDRSMHLALRLAPSEFAAGTAAVAARTGHLARGEDSDRQLQRLLELMVAGELLTRLRANLLVEMDPESREPLVTLVLPAPAGKPVSESVACREAAAETFLETVSA